MQCLECAWSGTVDDLIEVNPEFLEESDTIAEQVTMQYMTLLAKHAAQPIGLAMIESGICGRKDSQRLARLIQAAVTGAYKSTIDEVLKIMQELIGDEHDN